MWLVTRDSKIQGGSSRTYEDGQGVGLDIVGGSGDGIGLGVGDKVRVETLRDGVGRHLNGGQVVDGEGIWSLSSSQADNGRGEESEADHVGDVKLAETTCGEEDEIVHLPEV
jgi:hypothetical protein